MLIVINRKCLQIIGHREVGVFTKSYYNFYYVNQFKVYMTQKKYFLLISKAFQNTEKWRFSF